MNAEHTCHVCGCDHQQAPLSHCLDSRVQERGRGAIRIEVHSVVPARPLQHDQTRVPLPPAHVLHERDLGP